MDDLEYSEFLEYPCRVCGSIEYRYYGGGYNCKEGHRNEELREQVADEDDFDFTRRSTLLSQSRLTPQTARVATKKFRKSSGKGKHDVNERYGITVERQTELFEEERTRFQRKGDKKKHVIMEASMQILILQCEILKNEFPNLWQNSKEKIEKFEEISRKLFQAYANDLSFPYSHSDTLHPEISILSPPFKPSKYFKRRMDKQLSKDSSTKVMDDLDKELLLEDYDYSNESELSDSEEEEAENLRRSGRNDKMETLLNNPNDSEDNPPRAALFPAKKSKPLSNPFSYLNMTFLTYLALIHTGVPVLFNDLARALEIGAIPGYRPDFNLSKDIVTVRFNINELRAFHTLNLPSTDDLYYNSRLMIEILARQCKVPDWKLDESTGDSLLMRLINEMALPRDYFPYIKSHIRKSIGALSFLIFKAKEDENPNNLLFLTPCSLTAGGILFFLRLLYKLDEEDDIIDSDLTPVDSILKSQKLPTQKELMAKWESLIEDKISFIEEPDLPIKDPDEFSQLIDFANRMLVKTCILDNSASIKGIFGETKFEKARKTKFSYKENIFDFGPSSSTRSIRKINLPIENFNNYISYPPDVNPHYLPKSYRLALRLIQKLIGIRPSDMEKIVKLIFEGQTNCEEGRVKDYRKKTGRKVLEKIQSEVYTYY